MGSRALLVFAAVIIASGSLATFAAADIDVLSWMWYRDELGYYRVVGEVENVGDSNAKFVMLTATWYSAAGSVVATDFSFAFLDIIKPGETSPFQIILIDEDVQAERVRLQWEWDETREQPGRNIRVRDINASYAADVDCLEVIGEVENLGALSAEFAMIILTCYDEEGEVVAVDFTFSTLDRIAPGATSPFKAYICERARDIKRYRYIVQYN